MANINYNVSVNTSQGVQALNNLQSKVGDLTSKFDGLKSVIGGLAIGAAITSLLRFADNVQDLSDATGIATQNLLGFQKAVQSFGGNAEVADKAILKLVTNIGAAADGSAEIQAAFGKVGVSLNDLATLSEQDILAKTIAGLEGLTDKSEQAFIKQQLLGKEFRNVATSGLAEAYAKATQESAKYAESIKAAADTQQKLETAISRIKMAALEALKPVADFINGLDEGQINKFIDAMTKLAASMAALWAIVKIIESLKTAIAVFVEIGSLALTFAKNLSPIGRIIAGFISGFLAAEAAARKFFDISLIEGWGNLLGITNQKQKELNATGVADTSAAQDTNTEAANKAKEAAERQAEAQRKVKAAIEELKNSLAGVTDGFIKFNQQNLDAIALQTELIGATQQDSEVKRANAEITKKAAEEIDKLEASKAKLNEAQKQQGGVALIDAEIAKIKERAEIDKATTESAIKNLNDKKSAYEALKSIQDFSYKSEIESVRKVQDIMDQQVQNMTGLEKSYAEIDIAARKSAESAIDAENSRRRAAQQTKMTAEEEKKYYDAATKGNAELKRAAEEQYNYSRKFSTGWNKALKEYVDNATNAARQAENIFNKAFQGLEDLIVDFVKTGKFEWKSFVNMMLEELLRSQIQQVFAGLMNSMSGSMSGGGLGGLLGGGNQQQQGGGGGGIMGALGGLFGGGAPGSSPNNPMYVIAVGGGIGGGSQDPLGDFINTLPGMKEDQKGGGTWDKITEMAGSAWDTISSGAGAVWDSVSSAAGSVWDSVSSGFGGMAESIGGLFSGGGSQDSGGGWMDAIGSAVGGLFDGWFANGGNIGAGKFGVVGENGPELVSGPASVTPMSGGTNVTYNINAVDAQSFKAMIAADPSFIYAVSMQGAKGMPAGR